MHGENFAPMSVQIHHTEMLDYKNFVDLCTVNGEVRTIHYVKVKEPNEFRAIQDLAGDQVQTVRDEFQGEEEDRIQLS